jgi:hypothetical protein
MFSDVTIALLFAIGASAWIYAKEMRSTGSNTKGSLVIAGGGGLLLFLAMLAILGAIS